MNSSKKRVLILSANPMTTPRIRLDKEIHDIQEGLKRSRYSDKFEIYSELDTHQRDFRRALLDHNPDIVHFIGHGEKTGLIVGTDGGSHAEMSAKALSGLFELFSNKVECVILSACFSEPQARAIGKHIDYVIGMKKEIKDEAAIEFAVGFFDALGAGRNYEEAFAFGRSAIQEFNLPGHQVPVLRKRDIAADRGVKNKIAAGERPITVAIRSFKHPAHDFANQVDEMLCLCDHFAGRELVKGTWEGVVQEVKDFIALTIKAHRRYNLYLPLHSSLTFLVGRTIDPKCGAEINIFQPSPSAAFELWRFKQLDYLDGFHPWTVEESVPGNTGDELAAAISITHSTIEDVEAYIKNTDVPISRVIHLKMDHTNPRAIKDENQAYTAAYRAVVQLRDESGKSGASKLNLFLAAPNVFTFLLGQQSRLLGEITLYEHNFGSRKAGDYFPAFTLTP